MAKKKNPKHPTAEYLAQQQARAQAELLVKQTAVHKQQFLDAYALTGNVSRAAALAGVGRRTHYDWLQADEVYAAAFALAVDDATDMLEAEARRRAIEGLVRYKFQKDGTPVWHPDCYGVDPNAEEGKETEYSPKPVHAFKPYFEREYSDTLLIFLLKGARPEKYAERHKHTGAGKQGSILLEAIVAGEKPAVEPAK